MQLALDLKPAPIPARLAWAMALAALICLALTATTYGTNDILFFKSYAVKEAQVGAGPLYRDGARLVEFHPDWVEQMAHPPAMLHVWRLTKALEDTTGIPFRVWFRLATLLAHLAISAVLFRLQGLNPAILYVLCPAALMVAGFHGNSDPLVVAFLILAVYSSQVKWPAAVTGGLFALACSIKVWPLFLLLAFLLKTPDWRRRAHFTIAAAVTGFLAGLPYTVTLPRLVASTVFGYRSSSGWWGLSGIWPEYAQFGTAVAFASIFALTVALWRYQADLYRITGAAIALFLVLTPGFGVQYLMWVLPFSFVFRFSQAMMVYGASSVFLFAIYTKWSGGLPWYFADVFRPGSAQPGLLVHWASSMCWLVLALVLVTLIPGVLRPEKHVLPSAS